MEEKIARGHYKNIIIVSGAGISTNAGIPDYRSKHGLFAELLSQFPQATSPEVLLSRTFVEKYNVFDNILYKEKLQQIREAQPTSSHHFCKWLFDKGWLRRVYTQNIDGLHQKAGLSDDMVVEYHGSLIKENVILYGDSIPDAALKQTGIDFDGSIDLIIVMGTSLQVAPFCAIPNLVPRTCPRILIDLNPQNVFVNSWSKFKSEPEGIYSSIKTMSNFKLAGRLVSLRPQWNPRMHNKWKEQYIIASDVDNWCTSVRKFDI